MGVVTPDAAQVPGSRGRQVVVTEHQRSGHRIAVPPAPARRVAPAGRRGRASARPPRAAPGGAAGSHRRSARAQVAGALWPDSTDERALASLRRAVLQCPERCPGLLDAGRSTIALDPTVQVDVDDVRRAAVSPSCPMSGEAARELLAALGGDELLPGWYDDWVDGRARSSLEQLRVEALDRLSRQALDAGDLELAIDAARCGHGHRAAPRVGARGAHPRAPRPGRPQPCACTSSSATATSWRTSSASRPRAAILALVEAAAFAVPPSPAPPRAGNPLRGPAAGVPAVPVAARPTPGPPPPADDPCPRRVRASRRPGGAAAPCWRARPAWPWPPRWPSPCPVPTAAVTRPPTRGRRRVARPGGPPPAPARTRPPARPRGRWSAPWTPTTAAPPSPCGPPCDRPR